MNAILSIAALLACCWGLWVLHGRRCRQKALNFRVLELQAWNRGRKLYPDREGKPLFWTEVRYPSIPSHDRRST